MATKIQHRGGPKDTILEPVSLDQSGEEKTSLSPGIQIEVNEGHHSNGLRNKRPSALDAVLLELQTQYTRMF